MPNRIAFRQPRKHFIRKWREFRGLTQDQLAERLEMSKASLSRIENLKQPYTQNFLEAAADALSTDVASLLIRDPTDPDALWSIVDNLKPAQRKQAIRLLKALADEEAA
jgi:transcriptional regulator with XRE-family HTH domain